MRLLTLCNLFGCPRYENPASTRSPFRAKIDDPVSRLDHIQIVFDDDYGVSCIDKSVQHSQQMFDIDEVKSRRRLVEDVNSLACRPLTQFASQLYTLSLTPR